MLLSVRVLGVRLGGLDAPAANACPIAPLVGFVSAVAVIVVIVVTVTADAAAGIFVVVVVDVPV